MSKKTCKKIAKKDMAKVSIRLDMRRATANGTYPVKLAFSRNGKTAYIPLNIYIRAAEWDKRLHKVVRRNDRDSLNIHLNSVLSQANVKVLELQEKGVLRLLSDKDIVKILTGAAEEAQPHYFDIYFQSYISLIQNNRTKDIYESTRKKLATTVSDYDTLKFEDITPTWLRKLEARMKGDGLKTNTRAIHLRNIRAVFNAALADDLITRYPFKKFKIKSEPTSKRALSVGQLQRLINAPLPDWQRKYRDVFFLGLYLRGINVVDLSKIKEIKDGRIEFTRTKVARANRKVSIKVEREAAEIINKYRGEAQLLQFFDTVKSYKRFSNRLNENLNNIGEALGIGRFTYYACRHTWATIAANLDVPKETIALALGHVDGSVTDIYIKPNYDKVDEANRAVIDHILAVEDVKK